MYKAMSITLEFELKISHTRSGKGSTWTTLSKSTQPESKVSTYTPTTSGHQCKTSTLKVMEVEEEPYEQPTNKVDYIAVDANDVVEISLHANLGKPHLRTMKVQ
ncbi:hypothetical protein Tco_1232440, partial [Tanacetum coccineum]